MAVIIPLLALASLATCQPHGYQYQLPKEYNSYSQQDTSYSHMEPFRRFLRKYISQESHPYRYMSHPMANVPVSNIGFVDPKPTQYHQKKDWDQYRVGEAFLKERFFSPDLSNYHHDMDRDQYMLGEVFFKDHDEYHEEEYDEEQLPYTVLQTTENYEKRLYPSARYVCNITSVDTAGDLLAGLEKMNPFEVMMSRRYQKTPRSQQFMELFRYISGVNQNQEEIEMTRPVVVFHNVTKESTIGNYEDQTMCFYLPQKYQEHQHGDTAPAPRHAAAHIPAPLNDRVFIWTHPPMEVFVRRFGGFALTHDTWEQQKEILEEDILGQKYNPAEYFTVQYDNPWKLTNKRNEVWIQSHQQAQTLPAQIGQARRQAISQGKGVHSKSKSKSKWGQNKSGKPAGRS